MITFSEPTSEYFGVYPDLREEEFTGVKPAIEAGAFVVVEILSKTRINGTFKNEWYDFRIYNDKGIVSPSIQYVKWGLELIGAFETGYGREYDHTLVKATFIDPYGKKNGLGQQGTGRAGIRASLRKLKEMAQYESYQNFCLSQQVSQLEKEVERLKEKLAESLKSHA